jgi:hypothetical protein
MFFWPLQYRSRLSEGADMESISSARKTTTFLTTHTISEVLTSLSQAAPPQTASSHPPSSTTRSSRPPSPPQSPLLTLLLNSYFSSPSSSSHNLKPLEKRLKEANQINNLGDFPWTSNFEDVLEEFRDKVRKLVVEMLVEEWKRVVEGEVRGCFGGEE